MSPTNGEHSGSVEESQPERPNSTADGLTRRFWEPIRVFAARRLADPTQAEDLAQETIRRVLDALAAGRVADPQALPAFVFRTAHNLCLLGYRAASRQARAFARLAADGPASPATDDPLTRLISEEDHARVRRAMGDLSEGDRDLLKALYYDQLDPAEVARRLGVTPATLRVRRHRAVQRLAASLQRREPIGNL